MNKILAYYMEASMNFQNDLEQLLERKLTLQEYNSIRNFGSGMMLESFDMAISRAKTKEQAEAVLTDLITMKRLQSYLIHYNEFITQKGFSPNSELDSLIMKKGNCIDLMLLIDAIEVNKFSKTDFQSKIKELIDALNNRK